MNSVSESFINSSIHLSSNFSLQLSMQKKKKKKIHFQCYDWYLCTFFLWYSNPFLIIVVTESCEQMKNCFYIWLLFIIPWCLVHFEPKLLYILPNLSLLWIFHNAYIILILSIITCKQSLWDIWYKSIHIWSKYLVVILKKTSNIFTFFNPARPLSHNWPKFFK